MKKIIYFLFFMTLIVITTQCRKDKNYIVNQQQQANPNGLIAEVDILLDANSGINPNTQIKYKEKFFYSGGLISKIERVDTAGNIQKTTTFYFNSNKIFIIENSIDSNYHAIATVFLNEHSYADSIMKFRYFGNKNQMEKRFFSYDNDGYIINQQTYLYDDTNLIAFEKNNFVIQNGNKTANNYEKFNLAIAPIAFSYKIEYWYNNMQENKDLHENIYFWYGKKNKNLLCTSNAINQQMFTLNYKDSISYEINQHNDCIYKRIKREFPLGTTGQPTFENFHYRYKINY